MQHALNLTFDDGPDELWTMRMLEVLRAARARATFFMVGERVCAARASARAVVKAGHEVQLHCHRHVRHSELSEVEIERDTREGLAVLEEIGVQPTHWRTPWGIQTAATERVAGRHQLRLVNWTVDTHDWRGDSGPTMLARARVQIADGGVVLMHDALGPGALRTGCENTVELLAPLIAAARHDGLYVGALSLHAAARSGHAGRPRVKLRRR